MQLNGVLVTASQNRNPLHLLAKTHTKLKESPVLGRAPTSFSLLVLLFPVPGSSSAMTPMEDLKHLLDHHPKASKLNRSCWGWGKVSYL